ncbi:unnamed protein product [Vitrella brassicaformis CCMP3155]|uniref:Uncharacterized protein n=1 Tax=Vitrella brassicaformis (strain CCMP3155) TaxID=1169540 RepID=A0A0G4EZ23_VITBC|nr:unnamed protein product [Vitrella brassicaformis CCMP3155]|mmetsp:Transcript_48284/g.120860  ORF Transcript_48284/g.120860 Transcript_48284/m.120860 type:complete len:530 (-) Transcript_48284:308-1897(-)|eukprot:CEM04350.1 unnamed protein product [Vitrella brassicaformis CCMP3155]
MATLRKRGSSGSGPPTKDEILKKIARRKQKIDWEMWGTIIVLLVGFFVVAFLMFMPNDLKKVKSAVARLGGILNADGKMVEEGGLSVTGIVASSDLAEDSVIMFVSDSIIMDHTKVHPRIKEAVGMLNVSQEYTADLLLSAGLLWEMQITNPAYRKDANPPFKASPSPLLDSGFQSYVKVLAQQAAKGDIDPDTLATLTDLQLNATMIVLPEEVKYWVKIIDLMMELSSPDFLLEAEDPNADKKNETEADLPTEPYVAPVYPIPPSDEDIRAAVSLVLLRSLESGDSTEKVLVPLMDLVSFPRRYEYMSEMINARVECGNITISPTATRAGCALMSSRAMDHDTLIRIPPPRWDTHGGTSNLRLLAYRGIAIDDNPSASIVLDFSDLESQYDDALSGPPHHCKKSQVLRPSLFVVESNGTSTTAPSWPLSSIIAPHTAKCITHMLGHTQDLAGEALVQYREKADQLLSVAAVQCLAHVKRYESAQSKKTLHALQQETVWIPTSKSIYTSIEQDMLAAKKCAEILLSSSG